MLPKIRYFLLPAVGPAKQQREGSWPDVLDAIPYLLRPGGPIPPYEIVNEVLQSGVRDAGMSGGCAWEPAELNRDQYEEVVQELLALREKGYKRLDPPQWVRTESDFILWATEVTYGVPAEQNRKLFERDNQLMESMRQARQEGDLELLSRLEEERNSVSSERRALFRRYRLENERPSPPKDLQL